MKPLVVVHWVDIVSVADWTEGEEVELPHFKTVGWLHSESKDWIRLGDTMSEENKPYGITMFPKGCIEKIEYVSSSLHPYTGV